MSAGQKRWWIISILDFVTRSRWPFGSWHSTGNTIRRRSRRGPSPRCCTCPALGSGAYSRPRTDRRWTSNRTGSSSREAGSNSDISGKENTAFPSNLKRENVSFFSAKCFKCAELTVRELAETAKDSVEERAHSPAHLFLFFFRKKTLPNSLSFCLFRVTPLFFTGST